SLINILLERKKIAEATFDPLTITQKRAEQPITPQEAVMRTEGTIFPVADLKDYLGEITPQLNVFVSKHYCGELTFDSSGDIKYVPNVDIHIIREYPVQDNLDKAGGIEIFEMPNTSLGGTPPKYRYIAGIDPYDDDFSTTTSL